MQFRNEHGAWALAAQSFTLGSFVYAFLMSELFLCGDVMTGRGVDQVLAHPGKAELFESYVRSDKKFSF